MTAETVAIVVTTALLLVILVLIIARRRRNPLDRLYRQGKRRRREFDRERKGKKG